MPKRSRAETDLEDIFEKLFDIANKAKVSRDTLNILEKVKQQALSAAAAEKEFVRKAATDFTLEEAVQTFGLTYTRENAHWWKIEVFPEVTTFQPSAYLVSLLNKYAEIYDRSSKAACRVPVNFFLCECIAQITGDTANTSSQPMDGRRTQKTSWDSVKIHCEVSFTHEVSPVSTIPEDIIVSGRVDHGVGIVIRSRKSRNRLFHSLLLSVEANFDGLGSALEQLVVYLACLRQSRSNRGRNDTSVYGVATDGFNYTFVTITHEGVLKLSKMFDITRGDTSIVLGCFRHIFQMTMSMTPNSGLNADAAELEADADPPVDVDDNPYVTGPDDEEEEWY